MVLNEYKDGSFGNNKVLRPKKFMDYNEENSSQVLGGDKMNENNILEKYMDKVDQDRRDQEIRITQNMQLMEQRITEERRLSEERIEKKFNETMQSIKETNLSIDSKFDKLESKYENLKWWIMATCLATILGIVAIAASVWVK
ncbi:MAG: hypothetical protein E7A11_04310 [Clostridium sp.]|uniref:hypothetical protein n=1 Tax=Clostridium sp. TaxID=1506 RepID=UPI002900ACAA|nr:hypothetical protein [Clostridium sp.]MDU1077151.1 hypothetical protein [Clostridium sp.]MDU1124495.1 hypothetical protein [Clostridium sp.]MDU3678217.1 hypothetical protein [Clostridium sp.]MDU5739633.1 hypothetical protein [Clostridium sp.]MDU5784066.1 hypothetical protein [Clostridium sp.]